MKKYIYLLSFLFLLLLSYTVRQNINKSTWVVENLQNQFDSLSNDVIFSQQEIKRRDMDWLIITWFLSVHDFPSLWIKIYSDDPYSESFKTTQPFIINNENTLIDRFSPYNYIKVIAKDPNADINDIFEKKYFKWYNTWCYITILTWSSLYFTWEDSHDIIIFSVDTNLLDHECYVGKIPNERFTQLWYNKRKPDRYYVVNLYVWCAPWKCNVFNLIELY